MIIRIIIFFAVAAVLFFSVYHFVKWYARKLHAEISGDAADLEDAIKENRTERKELLRKAREGERLAKSAVKEYGKIKKSM